jgi:hypothetical protein
MLGCGCGCDNLTSDQSDQAGSLMGSTWSKYSIDLMRNLGNTNTIDIN